MNGTTTALDSAPLPYPQTPESANSWFIRHGICKTHWASSHGFDRMTVVDLLRGRLKGLRGEAHHAAVALGLKANPASPHSAAA
ncbi:DNA-binding protein [Pseudomonas syringae]|uniref:DNA-binding protein n=1 Tax=Pseudomonas syringae TaxID=317 RepID=UPI000EFE572C|nr:DNA-binding protein [Pseudomonas azotoformans]